MADEATPAGRPRPGCGSEKARAFAFRGGHGSLGLNRLVQGFTELSKAGLAQLALAGAVHGMAQPYRTGDETLA